MHLSSMRYFLCALLLVAGVSVSRPLHAQVVYDLCMSCGDEAVRNIGKHDYGRAKDLRYITLSMHNAERARWNAPALKWDSRLAANARRYAAHISHSGILQHSHQASGTKAYGENLWMGTRGAFSYADMVAMFLDERRYYLPRAVPDISTTGRWKDTGHYSQIIWRTTTRVGCGVASGPDFDALVCHYDPAGNIWGRRAHDLAPEDSHSLMMASN